MGSRPPKKRLDAHEAQQIQYGAYAIEEVLVWRICFSAGYERFWAVPHMMSGSIKEMPVYIEGATLLEVRSQLPERVHPVDPSSSRHGDCLEAWIASPD